MHHFKLLAYNLYVFVWIHWVQKKYFVRFMETYSEVILGMDSAKERRRYVVTPHHFGWAHAQNDSWFFLQDKITSSVEIG